MPPPGPRAPLLIAAPPRAVATAPLLVALVEIVESPRSRYHVYVLSMLTYQWSTDAFASCFAFTRGTIVTRSADLLSRVDLPSVLAAAPEQTCFYFCTALASAARACEGDDEAAALLHLLSDVSAFSLRGDEDPPLGHRTTVFDRKIQEVADLDSVQLDLLASVVELVQSSELRARIADVLFIRRRHNRFATLAIEAYLEVADQVYDVEDWVEASERYIRALSISGRISELRDRVLAKFVSIFEARRPDPGYCTAVLMDPMIERRIGDASRLAAIAYEASASADIAREWNRARRYLLLQAAWLGIAKDEAGKVLARVQAAERIVRNAQQEASPAVAALHLTSAVHALRQIPGQQARVEALLHLVAEQQRAAVVQFAGVSDPVDVTDAANRARARFAGLSKEDALVRLVLMYQPSVVAEIRRTVEEQSRTFLSQRLVPMTVVNSRGRVTARRGAIGAGTPEEQQRTLLLASYEYARTLRHFDVGSRVMPIWHQIVAEHEFVESDLIRLVEASPFCPGDRAPLFVRGLIAGFRGEFAVALYVLLPQVEHGIRCMLENGGAITWKMDMDGVQQDRDLGSLLFMQEAAEVFGEDLLFELRGLLIEKSGSNLRNAAAHGLLSSNQSEGAQSVYFWWLTLVLLFRPMLRGASHSTPSHDAVEDNDGGAEATHSST